VEFISGQRKDGVRLKHAAKVTGKLGRNLKDKVPTEKRSSKRRCANFFGSIASGV
jgi:hypothetical protein